MDDASRVATAFEPRFTPLETWANRALSAETVPMAADAFDARIFARAVEETTVVDAWLARTGTSPGEYSARGSRSLVDDGRMTHVRLPDGRRMRVGFETIDDPRTNEADSVEVIVLEHTANPTANESISFAVAFERGP